MSKIPFGFGRLAFVIAGSAFEYYWMDGFERLDKYLTRLQKIATGAVLLSIAAAAFSYGLFGHIKDEL